MRAATICVTALLASFVFINELRAADYYRNGIHSGLPYYGYGYSGSLYGLGRVPVPPYYALHPPVYYSHEIRRRPTGDSPYAYSSRRPAAKPKRQLCSNPFVPDAIIEESSEQAAQAADSVAGAVKNPFYGEDQQTMAASKMIYNPYYAKPEAVVAQASD